jgi:molecular chaperone DnaK
LQQQRREFLPVIIAGVAVGALTLIGPYLRRAYDGMKREQAENAERGVDGAAEGEGDEDLALHSVLGLDLGSSFSKISHYKLNEGVKVLENREGRRSIPSAILRESIEASPQVGHMARAGRFLKPDSTVFGVPLLFASKYMDSAERDAMFSSMPFSVRYEEDGVQVSLGVEKADWKAEGILTTLADEIHRDAAEKVGGKADAVPVILTSPNFLSDEAREAYLDALRGSGLNAVAVVSDAVSSALGAYKLKSKGMFTKSDLTAAGGVATVAVIDIGGRLTQLSLLTIRESKDPDDLLGFTVTLIGEKTLFSVGGEFFDSALVDHMAASFEKEHGVAVQTDGQALQRLHDAAEVAKKDLTKLKMASVNIPFISANAKGPLHLTANITRSQLDGLSEQQQEQVKSGFKDLLFSPDSKAQGPLLSVLLCGGAGRMPFAKKMVSDVSGMVPVVPEDPECLASVGAAASIEMSLE